MSSHSHDDAEQLFLCRANGEGSHEFRVCKDEAEVMAFYKEIFGEDYGGGIQSQIDHFRDADNWSNEGAAYECELYCATFEVWKVAPGDLALRAAPPTTKPSGEAWIPVSECLPNNHQHCLIWLDGAKLPCIGTLNRRHAHSIGSELVYYFAIANGSGDRLLEEVTHWMPLPPKPTKEPK